MSPPPTWKARKPSAQRISRMMAIVKSMDVALDEWCGASFRARPWQTSYRALRGRRAGGRGGDRIQPDRRRGTQARRIGPAFAAGEHVVLAREKDARRPHVV